MKGVGMRLVMFCMIILLVPVGSHAFGVDPIRNAIDSYRAVDDIYARDREDNLRQQQFELERQRYQLEQQRYENERSYREEQQRIQAEQEKKTRRDSELAEKNKWKEEQAIFFKMYPHYISDQTRWDALNTEVINITRQNSDKSGLQVLIEAHFIVETSMTKKEKKP